MCLTTGRKTGLCPFRIFRDGMRFQHIPAVPYILYHRREFKWTFSCYTAGKQSWKGHKGVHLHCWSFSGHCQLAVTLTLTPTMFKRLRRLSVSFWRIWLQINNFSLLAFGSSFDLQTNQFEMHKRNYGYFRCHMLSLQNCNFNSGLLGRIMVLILDGNSEIGAHLRSNLCYLIC